MEVDYLVVGQGLAGTLVSYNLIQKGKKILVFDTLRHNSSSRVAAGLYNPITGPRALKTWLADDLFPLLEPYYESLEEFLGVKFLHKKSIFRPFESVAEQNNWYAQSVEPKFKNYVEVRSEAANIQQHFQAPLGGIDTKMSGYVDVKELLDGFVDFMASRNQLIRNDFEYSELVFTKEGIQYKDIFALGIIFCEGYHGRQNPLFAYLPLNGTKGQILDIEIENYSVGEVFNKGIFVLPEIGRQRVGSTYEWKYEDDEPTDAATLEIRQKLEVFLKTSYKIVGIKTGIRPTTKDRRPLLGQHPKNENAYIFNGLGTKGVSLAPYFSTMFVNWLFGEGELSTEVDIARFEHLA